MIKVVDQSIRLSNRLDILEPGSADHFMSGKFVPNAAADENDKRAGF